MTPYIHPGATKTPEEINIPELCNVDLKKCRLKFRRKDLVIRRQVAMSLMVIFSDQKYLTIGAAFGKDHSTVSHSLRCMNNAMFTRDTTISDILIPAFVKLYNRYQFERIETELTNYKTWERLDRTEKKLNYYIFAKMIVDGIQSGKYTHTALNKADG